MPSVKHAPEKHAPVHTRFTVRHSSHPLSVANAALVNIFIKRGPRPEIVVSADPHIFWTRPGHTPSPERARSVLWVAANLLGGEELRIEPKAGQHHYFDWDAFVLDARDPAVGSGPVLKGLKLGPKEEWRYTIVVEGPNLGDTLVLDPIIIIEEDP